MLLSCVLRAEEIREHSPAVVLFPEAVDVRELARAAELAPRAILVGATREQGRCRAHARRGDRNRIEYWKIEGDGRTQGVGSEPERLPILADADIALGLVICMDVQRAAWVRRMIKALKAAPAPIKLLCIPGDMSGDYFSGPVLQPYLHGVPVAVCNHALTHRDFRCKSFVADAGGRKRAVQADEEPLHVDLPLGETNA